MTQARMDFSPSRKMWLAMHDLYSNGNKVLLVGGFVRDQMLGAHPSTLKDIDVEVYGITIDALETALSSQFQVDAVGAKHGILKVRDEDGCEYDFSVPRRDNKVGAGHKDFRMEFVPDMTVREACSRRDFSVNSMAYDPFENVLYDYFGGEDDLNLMALRHIGDAFSEDALRVLRGMRFAVRFGLRLDAGTADLCRAMASEYKELAAQRVRDEWLLMLRQCRYFGRIWPYLLQTGWDQFFPEVCDLVGVPQDPEHHPEGDCAVHVGHVVAQARQIAHRIGLDGDDLDTLMLAALLHDAGKPSTTEQREKNGVMRWTAHKHESASVPLAEAFMRRIAVPRDVRARVLPLVGNHMAAYRFLDSFKIGQIRNLALELFPASIQELAWVVEADNSGRPPLPSGLPDQMQRIVEAARADKCLFGKPVAVITGRHILPFYAGVGGPMIGVVVKEAYAAQVRGKFTTEAEGLSWLSVYLRDRIGLVRGEDVMEYFGGEVGPLVGRVMSSAWDAQWQGQFIERVGALAWLARYFAETPESVKNSNQVDQNLK